MTTISLRPALLALTVALLGSVADATAANKLYLDMSKIPGDSTGPGVRGPDRCARIHLASQRDRWQG